jgi:hypothetical protein
MSKLRINLEQEGKVLRLRFSGHFPREWRGKGLLFRSYIGTSIRSGLHPEIAEDELWVLGSSSAYKTSYCCDSVLEADYLYAKLLLVLTEWKASRKALCRR